MPAQPVLRKPFPPQVVNVGAALGPFNLNDFIESPDSESGPVVFVAELANGDALPNGLICTQNGTLSGIPADNTQGIYDVVIIATNSSDSSLVMGFQLTIKERISMGAPPELISDLKSRVWEALGKDLPLPDFADILTRPITPIEVYYLLQRFATLTIWDVYNLDPPGEIKLLTIDGVSSHFNVYDRGSCLVGSPKELYSHERTLEDALQTSRAMAREVATRNWVIEFAGFDKMVRAAWVELQMQGDKLGKEIEILHYTPTEDDLRIYTARSKAPKAPTSGL